MAIPLLVVLKGRLNKTALPPLGQSTRQYLHLGRTFSGLLLFMEFVISPILRNELPRVALHIVLAKVVPSANLNLPTS